MKIFSLECEVFYSDVREKLMYRTLRHIEYTLESGESIIVPKGFITDFASVPKWALSMINKDQGFFAAILHDYLYDSQYPFTENERKNRKIADKEFLFQLRKDNVSRWAEFWMYAGVRIGGKSWWDDTSKNI